ncbi:hypothetical protein RFI_23612, partial [Reticulomyxa filosa]
MSEQEANNVHNTAENVPELSESRGEKTNTGRIVFLCTCTRNEEEKNPQHKQLLDQIFFKTWASLTLGTKRKWRLHGWDNNKICQFSTHMNISPFPLVYMMMRHMATTIINNNKIDCVGAVAIFAESASIYADKYPSGATKESPNGHTGRGRYAAIFLVVCIIIDIVGLAFVVLNRSPRVEDYFRCFCHFSALVWCSLFFYNRLLKENPDMAWSVFWEEWSDIVLTIIVVLLLHNAYEKETNSSHDACFKSGLCSTYWVIFILQLTGWMLPMMTIEGWGAERHAVRVSLHLFILDLCTNVPIIIAIVATSFTFHF